MSEGAGILYLCTGSYQAMLGNSLNSLYSVDASANFHIISDRPLGLDYTWIPSLTGKSSRMVKTRLHEFTPYGLTLFVDTDTYFGEKIDIAECLGDADIAMGLDADPKLGRGARVFLNYSGFTSSEEVAETLELCGEDFPFFNSGVIVWRQTEKVHSFFERWNLEWQKYKRADQLALARALRATGLRVKTLDQRFNFPVLSNKIKHDKAIYHLIYKEKVAREVGLWKPDLDGLAHPCLTMMEARGSRASNHYLHIGQIIYNHLGSKTLVVCPGKDEEYWRYCTRGNCKFVISDSDPEKIEADDFYFFQFKSRVGIWERETSFDADLGESFDYVIVNGPKGFNTNCPGREIPIAWASSIATKKVFVFDYNREWERRVCLRYLGEPDYVISPKGRGDADLAVFSREEITGPLAIGSSLKPVDSIPTRVADGMTSISRNHIIEAESLPLITAVMITQPSRFEISREAIQSFRRQSYSNKRMLVVVQDEELADLYRCESDMVVICADDTYTLGELRNIAIDVVTDGFLIQWDDDDTYGDDRMIIQVSPLLYDDQLIASFLKSQIVEIEGRRFCRSLNSGIDGTILHRAGIKFRYPSERKGEDTVFKSYIPKSMAEIVDNDPMIYIRRFHGSNTWDLNHFLKIKGKAIQSQ